MAYFCTHCIVLSAFPCAPRCFVWFCFQSRYPLQFIAFICLKLHEYFLAVGNLNAFRPKWKISEMLDYLFLNKQLT